SEGSAEPAAVTFTPADWNLPQTIRVEERRVGLDGGDVAYTIVTSPAVSADGNFSGMDAADVAATNTDDDASGITVVPTAGLVTTEASGTASFTVVLDAQPIAPVTIPVLSGDLSEGSAEPAAVTFTPADWNLPQTIDVTGADDDLDDGDVAYTIVTSPAVSADGNFSGMDAADVAATNTDDDASGITVVPTAGLVTTEASGTASFTVVLDAQPTAPVTIPVLSGDLSEGSAEPAAVTFTPADWNLPQTI